jgi:filamentous hemagglutinin family protein
MRWKVGRITSAIACINALTGIFVNISASAQVTPDASLGVERSLVTPNVQIQGISADRIDGGAIRGSNLFHSFSQFNIDNGQRVYFANPTGIENIFSRVTGSQVSNILGTLGVAGNANLFLINPNGIIFGPNARLDINGSFLASTANSFIFNNGWEFNTTNPHAPPLLTINLNPGLQYGMQQNPASITSTANLNVKENLTLAAHNLDLQGELQAGGNLNLSALDRVLIRDSAMTPFIASAGGAITVEGNQQVEILTLHPESGFFAGKNLFLRAVSPGDVSFANYTGGSLEILAGGSVTANRINITSMDGANIPTLDIKANGNINIGSISNSRGTVILTNQDQPNHTLTGNIQVGRINTSHPTQAGNITLASQGDIILTGLVDASSSEVVSNSGQVTLLANGDVAIIDNANIDTRGGNGGGIKIQAENVNIAQRRLVLAGIAPDLGSVTSQAGDIEIHARGTVNLKASAIANQLAPRATGKVGNILITTGSLLLTDAASLRADSFGVNNAGNITINASDTVVFDYSDAFGRVAAGGQGNGGIIDITTGSLFVSNGGQLVVNNRGQGNAGQVKIQANDIVSFDGVLQGFSSGIFTDNRVNGLAGDIEITTGSLFLTNGAQFNANNLGQGNSGNVTIRAADKIRIEGIGSNGESSGIGSQLLSGGRGFSGRIDISTGSLFVGDGAGISTSTGGEGNAGTVIIRASDTVHFDGINPSGQPSVAGSVVRQGGLGNGGSVEIFADSIFLTNGAALSASTSGAGDAGNIRLEATQRILLENNSSVLAGAAITSTGKAGGINIVTPQLQIKDESAIAVNSRSLGVAGDIDIQAKSILLRNQGIIQANTAAVDGGNINIFSEDLLVLRRGSRISTNAGIEQGEGNGGNININATFIVAPATENSDITANAFLGQGGNININTQGIFGLQFREAVTDFSDITASSELGINGVVEINNPDIDPSQGLVELPTQVVDVSSLINENLCVAAYQGSAFIVTGRGGLPASPYEILNPEVAWEDWSIVESTISSPQTPITSHPVDKPQHPTAQIVEAQGMVKTADGTVILTDKPIATTPQRTAFNGLNCQRVR